MPEELMFMIEEMLKDLTNEGDKSKSKSNEVASNVVVISDEPSLPGQLAPGIAHRILHVSDFSGDLAYLVVNQFLFTSCAIYLFVFNLSDNLDTQVDGSECAPLVVSKNLLMDNVLLIYK